MIFLFQIQNYLSPIFFLVQPSSSSSLSQSLSSYFQPVSSDLLFSQTATSSSFSATKSTSIQTPFIAIGISVFLIIILTISLIIIILVLIKKVCLYENVLKQPALSQSSSFPNRYLPIDLPFKDNEKAFSLSEKNSTLLPSDDNNCPTRMPDLTNPIVVPNIGSYEYIEMRPTPSLLDESSSYRNSFFYSFAQSEISYASTFDEDETHYSSVNAYDEVDLNPSEFRNALPLGDGDNYPIYHSVYSNPQPMQRHETLLEVEEKNIRKLKDLGMGQFGEVELARTIGLTLKQLRLSESNNDPGVSLVVAVKRLKSESDETMREAFESEIKFMARLNHENVVRLLGVCLGEKAFIMMEYMEEGDLNNYLKALKFVTVDSYPLPDGTVDVAVLVYICLQVARGMKYLASINFIHRDLATRNILIGQDFKVKIADFGMSQNLYSSLYYRIKGKAVLPIRWMASECFYGQFSEKTDVWAFGVAMWEIFTLCQQRPYDLFTNQELIDDAVKGEDRTLLSQPETCPEEIYHVMLRCWVHAPKERANFEEVHALLSQIHAYSKV